MYFKTETKTLQSKCQNVTPISLYKYQALLKKHKIVIKLVVPSFRRLQGVTGQPRHFKMIAFRSPTFVIRHFYTFIYLFNAAPTLSSAVCWIAWAENSVRPSVRASALPAPSYLPQKKKLAELPSPKFLSGGLKCLNHPLGTSAAAPT